MKRNISKTLAILVTLALVMSLAAVSAFAVSGGETSFKKTFAIPESANVPNVEFTYTIVPGDPVPVGEGNEIAIFAGIGNPTIEHAVFPTNDTTPDVNNGTTDPTDSTKKIYIDNVFIDLSGINFTEAGVYRYVVTEENGNLPGVKYDEATTRYLDVFVFPQDTDNDPTTADELAVTTYSLTNTTSNFEKYFDETEQIWKYRYVEEGNRTKTSGYRNELETVDLAFSKKIEGNQADMTKRFEYTLTLSNVNPGTYNLEISSADVIGNDSNVTANNGAYTITVGSNGTYTGKFYLTNADYVKVLDLNKGYNYEVAEVAEDYTSTDGVDNDGTDNDYLDATSGSNVTADLTKTGYTNSRTGIIPTGVILTVAPFMIGLLLFGAIMMFMISRRRRATY